MSDKQEVIQQLQLLAENVIALKKEKQQKRPIIIEFSGSPKSGKTSCINSLEIFLKRNNLRVEIIQERASVCPVSDKQSPMFNIWTASMSLSGMIGVLESNKTKCDILILDRGLFDATVWFEWLCRTGKIDQRHNKIINDFFLSDMFLNKVDIVFSFRTTPEKSIEREYANLLTDKPGSIMNKKVLKEYLEALDSVSEWSKSKFSNIIPIDTTNNNQDEVSKEVTSKLLSTLNDFLSEKIGYFEPNEDLRNKLEQKNIFAYKEVCLDEIKLNFNSRHEVEGEIDFIQPLPVGIITNKAKSKVLIVKKRNEKISPNSPEKNKDLIYVGGHCRYEDSIGGKSFLETCRYTLQREIKEELSLTFALDDITPFIIYTKDKERSKMHMAICFVIECDTENLNIRNDPSELILNRGKSKSGTFASLSEIASIENLESWSVNILKHVFKLDLEASQHTLFDYNTET